MSVQRWSHTTSANGDYTGMGRFSEGGWVTYADHVAAVEKAYRDGHNDHARTVQHWQDTHGAYRQHGEGENP